MPIPLWREIEIPFEAEDCFDNPYLELEPTVAFTHEDGAVLRRPMFWEGGSRWCVRFAPVAEGLWSWQSACASGDSGLDGRSGTLRCTGRDASDVFGAHGFWHMSPGKRNVVHADGHPALIVADTAWALPWRSTLDQCRVYAEDRSAKGFNATLMMTLQPDRDARGPRERTESGGFDVAFEDLSEGRLTRMNPAYFRAFDERVDLLLAHGIVPVYQPVFHGYGWKNQRTAGNSLPPEDSARYCRYLVARYGARPAIYLVGGDGDGYAPGVVAGGRAIEAWDAYGQPAGIHYQPHSPFRAQQEEAWLDFQWCQTGHRGEHLPERVADMWRNYPPKGVANGEPTYENMGAMGHAAGWWQGHEAWCNLFAGGTMGVFYGAASLWQWRLSPKEEGHAGWCLAPGCGWREALDFEGSRYVGNVGKLLQGLPLTDMEPVWWHTLGGRGLSAPGRCFLLYLESGGAASIRAPESVIPSDYRIYDPKTTELLAAGKLESRPDRIQTGDTGEPRLVVFGGLGVDGPDPVEF